MSVDLVFREVKALKNNSIYQPINVPFRLKGMALLLVIAIYVFSHWPPNWGRYSGLKDNEYIDSRVASIVQNQEGNIASKALVHFILGQNRSNVAKVNS
ncbi:hypothetical protein [Photobacterium minamisatsumaniensis]|uniref:hypothetical protein n=1 Tax=Photobacterium minamisatsumaniensis TaxID=2910233 RepID=UPI003D130C2B